MNDLVSIILPFFNEEEFLEEAIDSVARQSFTRWELLLIDDGSINSSTGIAQRAAKTNPERIFYFEHPHHQNKGLSASRNLGLRQAKGEYIAFLDADDVWSSEKLEEQVKILDKFPEASMTFGPALYWYSWTGETSDRERDLMQSFGVEIGRIYPPPELLLLIDSLGKGSSACPSSIMIRREAMNQVGDFEERLASHEDQAFYMNVFLKHTVYIDSNCLIKYRRHKDAMMEVLRRSGKFKAAHEVFLNWVEEFLLKNGVTDRKVWKALQRARWPYDHIMLAGVKDVMLAPVRMMKPIAIKFLGHGVYQRLRRVLKGV